MMITRRTGDWNSRSGSRWFEGFCRSKAPRVRVFCFPHAGGSADVYRGWQRWFPEQFELCLVHLPGRGKNVRERAFTRVGPLVAKIADQIESVTDIPYVLYGHSMGALISFELARELSDRQNKGPEHLFVSGCRPPQYSRDKRVTFNLPREAFISELKKLNGTPEEVLENPELMEVFMDVLKADFELVETYEYRAGRPLSCPITVYSGIDDDQVPVETCHAWQKQTSAGCKVRVFGGDHFFIRNAQPVFVNAFRIDLLSAVSAIIQREF